MMDISFHVAKDIRASTHHGNVTTALKLNIDGQEVWIFSPPNRAAAFAEIAQTINRLLQPETETVESSDERPAA